MKGTEPQSRPTQRQRIDTTLDKVQPGDDYFFSSAPERWQWRRVKKVGTGMDGRYVSGEGWMVSGKASQAATVRR